MRTFPAVSRALLVAVTLALPAVIGACATHEYYDPDYHLYHRWDRHERAYYNRWEFENHRRHVDFFNLTDDDKRAYWQWRHDHQ